jgi:hypothetical protein
MRSDAATQQAILDMYHPPLSAPAIVGLKKAALALCLSGVGIDVALIHKLLIVATNAHQYYGERVAAAGGDMRLYETVSISEAPNSALFVYGSKIAHSCQPIFPTLPKRRMVLSSTRLSVPSRQVI